MIWTTKWPPRIDDPVQSAQLAYEAVELGGSLQPLECANETQFPFAERGTQEGKKLAAEHTAEHADRQEEPFPASNPTSLVGRDTASGHQTMQMRMMQELLVPGMQHSQKTDPRSETPWVGGDREQRLRDRTE